MNVTIQKISDFKSFLAAKDKLDEFISNPNTVFHVKSGNNLVLKYLVSQQFQNCLIYTGKTSEKPGGLYNPGDYKVVYLETEAEIDASISVICDVII